MESSRYYEALRYDDERHGPYGDIQKEWVNTYNPKQKFSGKERETYSDLDYFGARYYDNTSYRFTSVDPVRNRKEALGNPQLWNLYAYCRNNPITFVDPDGREFGPAPVDARADHYNKKYSGDGYAEYIRQMRTKSRLHGTGMVAAGVAGFIVAYFSPEIIAAMGPVLSKLVNTIMSNSSRLRRLYQGLSNNSLKHISNHLTDFRLFDKSMTLRKLTDIGHKIASNSNNLVSKAGGRAIYDGVEKIGGVRLPVRVILNTTGKLKSVFIKWGKIK